MLMDLAVLFAVVLAALLTWLAERSVADDRAAIVALGEDRPHGGPATPPSSPTGGTPSELPVAPTRSNRIAA